MMKLYIFIYSLFTGTILSGQKTDYPTPHTKNMLFYIQRNHNENAIVYDAKFDSQGNLTEVCPVDVYWIRYQENGQRRELYSFEKWMAYGIKCQKSMQKDYDYRLYLSGKQKT